MLIAATLDPENDASKFNTTSGRDTFAFGPLTTIQPFAPRSRASIAL